MNIDDINKIDREELSSILLACCGSQNWVNNLIELRPFRDFNDLLEKSNFVWYNLDEKGWKEAFSKHPQIGDIDSLRKKFSKHDNWSKQEQSAVNDTDEQILISLKNKNEEYYNKNGFIFIIFATGKSAKEMLNILNLRLSNTTDHEVNIASREQNKITRLRLEKLVNENI